MESGGRVSIDWRAACGEGACHKFFLRIARASLGERSRPPERRSGVVTVRPLCSRSRPVRSPAFRRSWVPRCVLVPAPSGRLKGRLSSARRKLSRPLRAPCPLAGAGPRAHALGSTEPSLRDWHCACARGAGWPSRVRRGPGSALAKSGQHQNARGPSSAADRHRTNWLPAYGWADPGAAPHGAAHERATGRRAPRPHPPPRERRGAGTEAPQPSGRPPVTILSKNAYGARYCA